MKRLLASVCFLSVACANEVVIDFEQTTIGKPVPTWMEKGVVFALAEAPKSSKAVGRVMFFPHLATNHKGLLNAMANEQAIPVQAKFPAPVSSVTIVFWASTGCTAKLQAFDKNDQLIDTASIEWLAKKGFDPVYGARPLKRVIQNDLLNPLSTEIISGAFRAGDTIIVAVKNGVLQLEKKN